MLHTPRFAAGRAPEDTDKTNKYVLSIIGEVPELLDIGCGDASLLVSASAFKSVGVAPTAEECESLQRRYPQVHFVTASAQRLPLADGAFDTVVCNGVLLLLQDREELFESLRELRRVARRQLFVGEVPASPQAFTTDISSPLRYIACCFGRGVKQGLSATKIIARAAFGAEVFITEPNCLIDANREQVESAVGLHATFVGERVPGRLDYLFSFEMGN
jgi:SAM-dependent methyltransferase